MRRAAVFFSGLLSACVAKVDAAPELSSIELSKSGEVEPNDPIGIFVRGHELWGRPLEIEVHFALQGGADRAVRDLNLRFDEELEAQTASTTWRLDPALLTDAGSTQIYFVATAEGERLESQRIRVEVEPVLLDIELIAPTEPGAGDELIARVTGRDVWSRRLDVEVLRGEDRLETLTTTFDAELAGQTALATWRVAGSFLDHPGRNELRFRARLGEQTLESEVLILEVKSEIRALKLFRQTGRLPLQAGAEVPAVDDLILAVEGSALTGSTSTITVYRAPNTVLGVEYVSASNSFELSFRPEDRDFAGDGSFEIFFRVDVAGMSMDSATVRYERAGFFSCDWHLPNGELLVNDTKVDHNTPVVLRASTWGLEDMPATFEIWEADNTSGDDFFGTLTGDHLGSMARVEWTAVYTEDGTLQSEAEYYFLVAIGGENCRSPQLIVRE